jgi:hypothetical protein
VASTDRFSTDMLPLRFWPIRPLGSYVTVRTAENFKLPAMNSTQAARHLRHFNLSQNLLRTNKVRLISSSSVQADLNDQKDAQLDRQKINTETNEGSKSGTDASSTSQDKASYNPSITKPQAAKEEAGKGNEHNPLDASGANPELGRPTEEEEPGAGKKTRYSSRKWGR